MSSWKDRMPAICAVVREQGGREIPGKLQTPEFREEKRMFGEKGCRMRTSEFQGVLLGQEFSGERSFGKEITYFRQVLYLRLRKGFWERGIVGQNREIVVGHFFRRRPECGFVYLRGDPFHTGFSGIEVFV